MVFTDYGDMGLGQLQAGVGSILDVFKQRQQQQQMQALGQQIQSGDLLGAAQTAIARGDINTGLKLYELHRKTGDEAGLGAALQGIFGGAKPATPTALGPQASAGAPADASAYAPALAGGETSATDPAAYQKLGDIIKPGHRLAGDRAYGKYQVMGTNVGPWTKEILGQEMTPQEFLANPQAQDAVFKGKFGQYAQQTGDPKAAAAMWFSGSPNTTSAASDQLGTSVPSYVSGFARRLGEPPAQPGGSALAYAPASQAITGAMGGFTTPEGNSVVDPNKGQDSDSAPITLAASTTPGAPRRLGSPPTASPLGQPPPEEGDSPELTAKIAQRNQLIGLMPQARGTKYETMIPAAVQSINEEIKALRDPNNKGANVTDQTRARMQLAPRIGLQPGTKEWQNFVATGNPGQDKSQTEAEVRQQRATDAEKYGLQPGSNEYRRYVLTGQDPSGGDQMKAFEAKALQTANDKSFAASQSIAQMEQALKLNDKALSGNFQPGVESFAYRNLPYGVSKHIADPERVIATTEFNNLAQSANLSLGKEMFGARVTNYDEQLLQQLRASVDKSPEERKAIILRLIDNRKAIAAQAKNEVDQIRSGDFFKKTKPGDVPNSVIHDNDTSQPPPGFVRAPDGEFYKPDPAYPGQGKYLKWMP